MMTMIFGGLIPFSSRNIRREKKKTKKKNKKQTIYVYVYMTVNGRKPYPDSVKRVKPPKTTIPNTLAALLSMK